MGEVKNNAIGGILNGPYCKSVTFSSDNPLLITQFNAGFTILDTATASGTTAKHVG